MKREKYIRNAVFISTLALTTGLLFATSCSPKTIETSVSSTAVENIDITAEPSETFIPVAEDAHDAYPDPAEISDFTDAHIAYLAESYMNDGYVLRRFADLKDYFGDMAYVGMPEVVDGFYAEMEGENIDLTRANVYKFASVDDCNVYVNSQLEGFVGLYEFTVTETDTGTLYEYDDGTTIIKYTVDEANCTVINTSCYIFADGGDNIG